MAKKTVEDKEPIIWDLSSTAVSGNWYGRLRAFTHVVGFLYTKIMPKITPTKYELKLMNALKERGVETVAPYWDDHKHVDIYIPAINLYIEVDGIHHYIDAKQFKADLVRDYYSSQQNISTKRISNQLVENHVEGIADAIAEIVHEKANN